MKIWIPIAAGVAVLVLVFGCLLLFTDLFGGNAKLEDGFYSGVIEYSDNRLGDGGTIAIGFEVVDNGTAVENLVIKIEKVECELLDEIDPDTLEELIEPSSVFFDEEASIVTSFGTQGVSSIKVDPCLYLTISYDETFPIDDGKLSIKALFLDLECNFTGSNGTFVGEAAFEFIRWAQGQVFTTAFGSAPITISPGLPLATEREPEPAADSANDDSASVEIPSTPSTTSTPEPPPALFLTDATCEPVIVGSNERFLAPVDADVAFSINNVLKGTSTITSATSECFVGVIFNFNLDSPISPVTEIVITATNGAVLAEYLQPLDFEAGEQTLGAIFNPTGDLLDEYVVELYFDGVQVFGDIIETW